MADATPFPPIRTAARGRHLASLVTALGLAALVALTACDLPRDPRGTTARARNGRLLVGASEAPPWVVRRGAEASGVEADLVRAFAATLGAEVGWVWGGLDGNLAALERCQLDIVVGGLDAGSPWSKRVGFTRPYLESARVVGLPPGTPAPPSLRGLRVAVRRGDALGAILADRDAVVVHHADPWASGLPVAAPSWEVGARGYVPIGEPLGRDRHVVAVPPGENGLLSALELFAARHAGTLRARLAAEAVR